jgi:hypothetical protein
MNVKTHRSTYVRVALSPDTDLNLELKNVSNRAARLLELATMGLALHKASLASQIIQTLDSKNTPKESLPQNLATTNHHHPPSLNDDLMRSWSYL